MLKLEDFFHLPQLDTLLQQLVADEPGLVVVAGLDPRPGAGSGFLPSGRTAIFRILMQQFLETHPRVQAIVVAESRQAVRVPRRLWRRVKFNLVSPPPACADWVADAARRRPGLVVVDRLDAETAPAALQAAGSGQRVLAQMDTVFAGADVARHLSDLGVSHQHLANLSWVVAVQRVEKLCANCKQAAPPDPKELAPFGLRYPELEETLQAGDFFQVVGCAACQHTGRAGSLAAFDLFRAEQAPPRLFSQPSQLPLQEYVLRLATLGHLPLNDATRLHQNRLHLTYGLLTAEEGVLAETNATLHRKLAQIEAANRVMEQRTEALFSLQDIGQALISSTELVDLASRVCRHAGDLCGADRAILYFLRPDGEAEVLAVNGWDPALVRQRLDATQVVGSGKPSPEPVPYTRYPPGVPARHEDVAGFKLQAGLRVPLVAERETVGLMIVQTSHKPDFGPGEVALLQAFANQAALAIQRAGLIADLRAKIEQLQAAQAELVKKERLERELELARQVQQSLMPRTFPRLAGYTFAAQNRPARRVGGDFYDAFALKGGRFGLAIADVSDKGMPAALFMALTRSLLRAEARREPSPRAVLINVHRLLLELGEPDMFVTLFYGVVDRATQRLTYARAGHDWPLLLRNGTVRRLRGDGMFLGYMALDSLNLSEEALQLAPGDRLLLYTDGLTDILDPQGQLFDLERLERLVQARAGLPPDQMCTALFEALAEYQGAAEQYDDMTMLVVDVE